MDYKHIHFVGIGGIGMSGLASILRQKGLNISGSDIKQSRILDLLKGQGIEVFVGHNQQNIQGADLIVYSSAIKPDNIELLSAKKLAIPAIKRAECLVEIMKDKTAIVICGSHGKTTTASLASHMLTQAGFNPTAAIGGIVRNWNNNIYLGKSNYFVAEADESDGTFLKYAPFCSIVTNIDNEHLDYYKDYPALIKAFAQFIQKTKEEGFVIGCADDIQIRDILSKSRRQYITYGLNKGCEVSMDRFWQNGHILEFNCLYRNKSLGRFKLNLLGLHNISNSLAVIALALELGIDKKTIYKSLESFQGAKRRFEIKFESGHYLIVDDYAHHPTEIKATLSSARSLLENTKRYKRIIAIFQPHRYSRTKILLDAFAKSFELADYLIITDIYAANESPIKGITAKLIYDKIKKAGRKNIEFLKMQKIIERVLDITSAGDLIITLGAGDIGELSDELSCRFKGKT